MYSDYLTVFAQCAQGQHEQKTEYGMCGIITAIVCLDSYSVQRKSFIHSLGFLLLGLLPTWSYRLMVGLFSYHTPYKSKSSL